LEPWRLIEYSVGDPSFNMALDEAIARCVGDGRSPTTLRFYGWSPEAVSIGYFQEIGEEIDLEFCKARGLDVVRRLSGGGSVVHAAGGLTYSFCAGTDHPLVTGDVLESYAAICRPIVSALGKLGACATFRPINDIEIEGKKVSGSAQMRRFGAVLQHGTLLLDLDFSLLRALNVHPEKLESRHLGSAEERVTTLGAALGRRLNLAEVTGLLAEEFTKSLGCRPKLGTIKEHESSMLPDLVEKYRSQQWLFRR
jgi:lipoate-protein ligase A